MFQVVKAFVVLTADHKSRDHKELIQELQTHVKTVTAPYKYPRKVTYDSNSVLPHLILNWRAFQFSPF